MNNDFDTFELLKHSQQSNFHEDLHRVPIISYGVIRTVVSISSAIVDTVVQDQQAQETYSVPLLYPSSALFEHSVYPKRGDLVLLLFVQRFNAAMFDDPCVREQLTGAMTLYDGDATGYTRFSGVGLLMRTPKNRSDIRVQHYETEENESAVLASVQAALTLELDRNISVLIDRHPSERADPVLASFRYGERAVYEEEHYHDARRTYGFLEDVDGALQELSAPVTEKYSMYAPVTKDIQGAQTTDVGLGTDKDGAPVETDAPVTETIHGKAPVTRDIRSPQTITVGIGNTESGDTEEQRYAPLAMTFGEKADIALTSKSALTAKFSNDIRVETEANSTETVGGDKKEAVTGKAVYTSSDTDIVSTEPVGINGGLYKTGLQPYLSAETAALAALQAAAASAAPQLAILDALSGGPAGIGFITGLGTAIAAFCSAMQSADSSAHSSIAKAVK
jgi:hypothetical protein